MTAPDLEQRAINVIRGLAMDAPHAARSGHQGTAMALAPLAHVLWTRVMRYDAGAPDWPDRDRFVLSAGHASILLYSMLHLTGYDLTLDDLRAFRQWGSRTPGHPERGHTDGVEVTTGPLGQGIGNAVGMALAERQLRARFGADVVDHRTFCVDGRRRPLRGPQPRGGVARRPPRPRPPGVRLRRQPRLDRRPHRAGAHRRRRRPVPCLRLARRGPRRGRRGPRRDRGRPAAGGGRGGPPVAGDPAQPHRLPVALQDRRSGHPRLRAQGRGDPRGPRP